MSERNLKVFTFFYNRYNTATTSKALNENGIPHYVMLHNQEQHDLHVSGNTLFGTPVITNNPKGLAFQRNSALDMVEDGEWCVFMCDDFKEIKAYNFENYDAFPSVEFDEKNQSQFNYNRILTMKEFFSTFDYLIDLAETANIHLIGFAFTANPRNNGRKFSFKGLVDGRCWIIKKSHLRFDPNVQLIDDVYWTALNLQTFKNNLVFNWIDPEFQRYTSGGFGSIPERLEQRRAECDYLVKKFPKLIRYAEKPGWESGTHIKVLGTGKKLMLVDKGDKQKLIRISK